MTGENPLAAGSEERDLAGPEQLKALRTFVLNTGPASGLDCLICAIFAGSVLPECSVQILCEMGIKSKLYGNDFYSTACSLLEVLKKSCSKRHCQKDSI